MKADRFERDMKEQSVKWKRTATSHLGKQPSHLAHTLSRPLHIFWKSRSLVPINGSVPLSNVYKRTPQLQISAGLPYDCLCTTSGAIKWGVPTLPEKKKYHQTHFFNCKKIYTGNFQMSPIAFIILLKTIYIYLYLKIYITW